MKGEINSNTIMVGDFNIPLTPMDRSNKQIISKETQTLKKQRGVAVYRWLRERNRHLCGWLPGTLDMSLLMVSLAYQE